MFQENLNHCTQLAIISVIEQSLTYLRYIIVEKSSILVSWNGQWTRKTFRWCPLWSV